MTSETKRPLVSLSGYKASVNAGELDINTSDVTMDVGMGSMCVDKHNTEMPVIEDCNSMDQIMKFMKKHHFHVIDMVTVLTEEHQKHHKYLYAANYCGLKVLVELDQVKHCGMSYSSSLFSHVKTKHHKVPVQVKDLTQSEHCKSIAFVCANGVCVYSQVESSPDYQVLDLVKVKSEKHHHKHHDKLHYAHYTHYDHKHHETHSHYVPVVKYSELYADAHRANKHILDQSALIMAHRCREVREMLHRVKESALCIATQSAHLHDHYLGSLDKLQTVFNGLYDQYGHPTCDKYGLRDKMCRIAERLRRCVDSVHDMERELSHLEEVKESLSKSLSACNACLESRY